MAPLVSLSVATGKLAARGLWYSGYREVDPRRPPQMLYGQSPGHQPGLFS